MYDYLGASAGVVRKATPAERQSTQRAWEQAVTHHFELAMQAKSEGAELAEQLQKGSEYYVLPCSPDDHAHILELLPDDKGYPKRKEQRE